MAAYIRGRPLPDVPKDAPVALICNTGLRAYDSELFPRLLSIRQLLQRSAK